MASHTLAVREAEPQEAPGVVAVEDLHPRRVENTSAMGELVHREVVMPVSFQEERPTVGKRDVPAEALLHREDPGRRLNQIPHLIPIRQRHPGHARAGQRMIIRSEEHTSELQSLKRTSYAVFCLKKNKQ